MIRPPPRAGRDRKRFAGVLCALGVVLVSVGPVAATADRPSPANSAAQSRGHVCGATSIRGTPDPGHPVVDLSFNYGIPAGAFSGDPVPIVIHMHRASYQHREPCAATDDVLASATNDEPFSLASLLDAGFAVVSWDARGHNCWAPGLNPSETCGYSYLGHPGYEYADLSRLIDWLAHQVWVLKDEGPIPNDVRVGLLGESMGAMIAVGSEGFDTTDAYGDSRIDAIAAYLPVCDLYSLVEQNGAPRRLWPELLFTAVPATTKYPSSVHEQAQWWRLTGQVPAELGQWLWEASPCRYVFEEFGGSIDHRSEFTITAPRSIDKPLLVTAGMRDGAGTPAHLHALVEAVGERGVPVKFVTTNETHTAFEPAMGWGSDLCVASCLFPCGNPDASIERWFRRHLAGDNSIDTGPRFEIALDDEGCARHVTSLEPRTSFPAASATIDVREVFVEALVTSAADLLAARLDPLLVGRVELSFETEPLAQDESLVASLRVENNVDPSRNRILHGRLTGFRLSNVVSSSSQDGTVVVRDLVIGMIGTELVYDPTTGENEKLFLRIQKVKEPYYQANLSFAPVALTEVVVKLPTGQPMRAVGSPGNQEGEP